MVERMCLLFTSSLVRCLKLYSFNIADSCVLSLHPWPQKAMDTLEDVLLVGNPIYHDGDLEDEEAIRLRVHSHIHIPQPDRKSMLSAQIPLNRLVLAVFCSSSSSNRR